MDDKKISLAKYIEISGAGAPGSGDQEARPGKMTLLVKENKTEETGHQKGASMLKERLNLDLKPEELEAYLDAYVIRQDRAKAVLATKVSTHFNRIRYFEEAGLDSASSTVGMIKNNILLIGPTGVGKTYLVKLIAQRLGVPFVKGDATKFSETGYVGGDVEDLVRDLVQAADDDIELAQYGIIYIDEVDKIASSSAMMGPDVSRTGVQRALLKPMEETEVDLKVPHDPISQIQAIEQYRKTGKRERRTVNTRNILFIMSGAFNGLDDIIKRRLNKQPIGFAADCRISDDICLLDQVTPQDLVAYGFESEFIGRLPVQVVLDELNAADLHEILLNPNNPVVLSKKRDFAAYGIEVRFEPEALEIIAARAALQKTGARGLVGAMEQTLLNFEKRLPSTEIKSFLVTPQLVESPDKELERLLADPHNSELTGRFEAAGENEGERLGLSISRRGAEVERTYGLTVSHDLIELVLQDFDRAGLDVDSALARIRNEAAQVTDFGELIGEEHGFRLSFEPEAIYTILRIARRAGLSPTDYLLGRQEELVSGLELVRSRTGLDEFILPREALMNTTDYVSALVNGPLTAGA